MEGLTDSKGWRSESPFLELAKEGFSHKSASTVSFQIRFSQICWEIKGEEPQGFVNE